MALSNESILVSIATDTLQSSIEEVTEGTLRSLVEYNKEEFNPLYIDDVTLSFYESVDHALTHFERIHSYVNIDFAEMSLFTEELFPVSEEVRYLVTGLDQFTVLRIYIGNEGLFIALDPDEPVKPVVDVVVESVNSTN